MARREAGIRERVSRALMVSAAIYAVAIGVWAIQTRQLSEASPTATTVNFDDKAAGNIAGNAYASQGLEISSPDGGGSGAQLFAVTAGSSAACPSYTTASVPNMLVAKPGSYAPLTVKFTEGRVSDSVSFSVGNAGNAEVAIEAFDQTGKSVTTKTIAAPGSGQCKNATVTLTGSSTSGIAEIRLKKNGAGTTDGYGIDNLTFSALRDPNASDDDQGGSTDGMTVSPTSGTAPLTVTGSYGIDLLKETFTTANGTSVSGDLTYTRTDTNGIQVTEVPTGTTCSDGKKDWNYDWQQAKLHQFRWVRTIPDKATVVTKLSWDSPDRAVMLGMVGFITADGTVITAAGYQDSTNNPDSIAGKDDAYGSIYATANDNQAENPSCFSSYKDDFTAVRKLGKVTGSTRVILARDGSKVTVTVEGNQVASYTIPSGLTPAGVAVIVGGLGDSTTGTYPFGTFTVESLNFSTAGSSGSTAVPTTVNFDDLAVNTDITNQYQAKGVTVSPASGSTNPIIHSSPACANEQAASSPPNYLAPEIGGQAGYGGATFTFTQPIKHPGVTLVSVGRSTVTLTYTKADGSTSTQTVGPNAGVEDGACNKNVTSYTGSELITKFTVQSNEAVNGADAYGLDDLTWVTETATPAPAEQLTWDFGDGTTVTDAPAIQQHTYTKAGTYTVTLKKGTTTVGTRTVTVSSTPTPAPTPTDQVSAAFTTSKPNYDRSERVEFTLKNTGTVDLELKNGAPFKISQGAVVKFAPVATQALETIAAGQEKTWTWDQKGEDGQQVADGTYVVTVDYSAKGQPYSRSAAFSIAATKISETGTFTVTPTSGTIPFTVTLTCTGDTIRDIVADWGDGTVTTGVTCPTTLTHTYSQVGVYTITLRQGTVVLGTQQVTALASATDGKGAPTSLASTGGNLIVLLIIATIVAGLFSYLIIRRPFHGTTA
ncbi:hypothetical protein HY374_01315 [Candidatus Berkelbacteria bacterium]|nr:hypothetical protein [Candidatus Berkelbacteria bacterium]